jgi:hypothetical protein
LGVAAARPNNGFYCHASRHLNQADGTMILTRSETAIQLTYTLEEYKEFNYATVNFKNELTGI